MLSTPEIDALAATIVEVLEPERAIVFGSYAKGPATPQIDLDVMVVKDTASPQACRADAARPLLMRRLVRVDVHVYTPEELVEYGREPPSFIDSVVTTGRTLYDRLADSSCSA